MADAVRALAHAAALATPSTTRSPAVLSSGEPSGWTLDVRAAKVPGWFEEPSGRMAELFAGCGEGHRNAAESECFAAATEAAQKAGRSVRGFEVVDDGARAGVPSGCSYSRVSGTAVFYRNPAGRYGSGYELVCVEDRSAQNGKRRAERAERFPRLRDVGPGESSTCADLLPGEGWSTQDYAAGVRVVYERAPTRSTQALALVLRGDMFRASLAAGIQCAQSIQDSIVTPAVQGATGVATAVDSFLSVYAESDSSVWEQYARPINASIALVSVVRRSSQLGGIAMAIESWRSYAERHEEAQYTAVLLLRYDLHWKAGLTDYLRDARFLGDQLQQVRPAPRALPCLLPDQTKPLPGPQDPGAQSTRPKPCVAKTLRGHCPQEPGTHSPSAARDPPHRVSRSCGARSTESTCTARIGTAPSPRAGVRSCGCPTRRRPSPRATTLTASSDWSGRSRLSRTTCTRCSRARAWHS